MFNQDTKANRPRISREFVLHWDIINETGVDKVDNYLYCLLNVLRISLGDDLCAVYLIGSYAHGGLAHDSDIDLCLIFRDGRNKYREAWSIIEHIGLFTGMMVDPMFHGCEASLHDSLDESDCCTPVLRSALKDHSILLLGEDIRHKIALSPHDKMLNDVLSPALIWIRNAHGMRNVAYDTPISYPLSNPHDMHEGFGDLHSVTIRTLHLARALIYLKTDEFIFNKAHIDTQFAEHVGGPWADLVHRICESRYTNMMEDRRHEIWLEACENMTAFENYFLEQIVVKGLAQSLCIAPASELVRNP